MPLHVVNFTVSPPTPANFPSYRNMLWVCSDFYICERFTFPAAPGHGINNASSDDGGDVTNILQDVCRLVTTIYRKLFANYLEVGMYLEEMKENATSCVPNNINLERLMDQEDRHLRKLLHAKQEYREAKLMVHNIRRSHHGWNRKVKQREVLRESSCKS